MGFGCFYIIVAFISIFPIFPMENPQEGIPLPQTEDRPDEADDATKEAPVIKRPSVESQNQQDYWLWIQLQVLRDRMKGSL